MADIDELLKEAPTLTFGTVTAPEEPEQKQVTQEEVEKQVKEQLEIELTPEERKMVDDFAKQIDIKNTQMVLQYGAGCQKKIADFSESALGSVRTKDMGQVGDMLTAVVAELRSIEDDDEDKGGFFGLFKKNVNKLANLKAKYDSANANVEKIVEALEKHQITLLKDVAMLDKMYELNQNYFKELSMYILAGKQRLKEAEEVELVALREKAEKSQLPEDVQAARDFAEMCNRFEKKIHDLELTRMIAIQTAPQIRLVQSSDSLMIEKIQSTIVNTIPLWKSQMVIALGIEHSRRAAEAQRQVSDLTNELLKKNAEKLKMATVETAKESERGIVDMETLVETNEKLISTIDEVMQIQSEGREKRREAEARLVELEDQLKNKLLQQ